MSKYGDWTHGETEALLNIIGGVDVARAVLRDERKLTVEEIVRQQPPANPPLVGTLIKKLVVKPYKAESLAKAIELGVYGGHDDDIITIFAGDEVGLTEEVSVDLFRFSREWTFDEVVDWAKNNGDRKPLLPKHIHGIGIQFPGEQREAPILEIGSVRRHRVLCLIGDSDWRYLRCCTVGGYWAPDFLVGFLSE
jgi:hypothetical protein